MRFVLLLVVSVHIAAAQNAGTEKDRFCKALIGAVEAHDWAKTVMLFECEAYRMQNSIGIEPAQFIEESLGLGMVNNKLIPKPKDKSPYNRLNGIDRLTILELDGDESSYNVRGEVGLFDGSKRSVEFVIRRQSDGSYLISPAVG